MVIIISVTTIFFLNKNINELTKQISLKRLSFSELQLENANLLKDIDNKEQILKLRTKELDSVNDKLGDIEELISLGPKEEYDITKRLDLAKIDSLTVSFIFRNVPNGYPIDYKGVTSSFGYRVHPTLRRKEFHRGIDLRAKMKTPVKSTADGIIEYAGYHKKSGFGYLVIIDHFAGFRTTFAHLHSVKVKAGDFVKKGDIVALSGNSGLSSGPHLHYEVRFIQRALNPVHFLNWSVDSYKSIFKKEKGVSWDYLIEAVNRQIQITKQQS